MIKRLYSFCVGYPRTKSVEPYRLNHTSWGSPHSSLSPFPRDDCRLQGTVTICCRLRASSVLITIFGSCPCLPLLQGFLPIGSSVIQSLLLLCRLVASLIPGPFLLHSGNGSIIKYLYGPAPDSQPKLLVTKRFARLVEVGDIELEVYAQLMPYSFLLEASPSRLSP